MTGGGDAFPDGRGRRGAPARPAATATTSNGAAARATACPADLAGSLRAAAVVRHRDPPASTPPRASGVLAGTGSATLTTAAIGGALLILGGPTVALGRRRRCHG
ncbi:hypothetical protein ABTX81_27295 [Kitasatospora sp. NPDC097605]|uniref:hypothetical protein n=1 Tax=Kitasatospora sp. NPDC097605 TaxID=3157226 RepID=UPI003324EADD